MEGSRGCPHSSHDVSDTKKKDKRSNHRIELLRETGQPQVLVITMHYPVVFFFFFFEKLACHRVGATLAALAWCHHGATGDC